jgi:phospholipase C
MARDRRKFLQAVGAGALAAAFPASIQRALAIPAHRRTGSIADVEHIVFLMQENRSFDHYFGTLRGVRGFGDPRAVKLPSGEPVWNQPDGSGRVLPFHPDAADLGAQFLVDLPHGWTDTHAAWNGGKYDQWVPSKGRPTMAYLKRNDIPFYYALADAFTVCDAYHCSLLGATDPNRYHLWTGWVGNDGLNGGPVVDNSEAGYDWHTFPERLVQAGISWKVYQDAGAGLDAEHFWGWGDDAYIGNYGDNALLYFHQYQNAVPGSPLHVGARSATDISHAGGTLFDQFAADVASGQLPQVSWIVAPEAYTEHGNWPSNYGSWYISQMLDALTANPDVWSKTVFFLMFDENDGFFDHMVPPTPPMSPAQGRSTVPTTNEIYPGNGSNYAPGPYGLGVRVPMLVISPFSKGGWVCSEVFDHTSLIRFVEKRFLRQHPEVYETNITPWRRAIAGDLTSTLDFKSPSPGIVPLPSTAGFAPTDYARHDDYVPSLPSVQSLPKQEPGLRPARPVPYDHSVTGDVDVGHGNMNLRFENAGKAAAVLQVRAGGGQSASGPWSYTVGSHAHLDETWAVRANGQAGYDLSVYGPNGFFRSFKGTVDRDHANLSLESACDPDQGITLEIKNRGAKAATVRIADAYSHHQQAQLLEPGKTMVWHWSLDASYGWYDLTVHVDSDASFERRLAGHVENGQDSMSDPALGA